MEVYLCQEFTGDGYDVFALCKTIERCKTECVNHLKHSEDLDSSVELIVKQVESKDDRFVDIIFNYNDEEFERTFYISKMPVLE